MKRVLWTIGGLVTILLLALFVTVYIAAHYEAGPPPISSARALSLVNDCYPFTHVANRIRQATSATHIDKGRNGRDAGSDLSFADIEWNWISGSQIATQREGSTHVTFRWVEVPGLSDYNFPESQWTVADFKNPGEEVSSDCGTRLPTR